MPLPAALLARLKQRGLVPEEPEEEIIAESYDEESGQRMKAKLSLVPREGYPAPACPNKNNIFHRCSKFCWEHWGAGISAANVNPEYNRKRQRLLQKYPLPAGWTEIFDPGMGRYYYWNVESDEVSWLSPTHPKAIITQAACRLSRLPEALEALAIERANELMEKLRKRKRRRSPSPVRRSPTPEINSDDEIEAPGRGRRRDARKPNDLDPMDPAAYSDVPRGKWSTGLNVDDDEAITGVDTTASGPLYQMRPYPAPGAILRRKEEMKKKR